MSNNPNAKLEHVSRQADQVANVARENIDKALARGEKLEDMEDKAAVLESQSHEFAKRSGQLKRKFCFQYYRLTFLILLVVAIAIVIIYYAVKGDKKD